MVDLFAFSAELFVGFVLVVAGVAKPFSPRGAVALLETIPVFQRRPRLTLGSVYALSAAEVVVGLVLALATGPVGSVGAVAALLLTTGFIAVALYASKTRVPCGCVGRPEAVSDRRDVIAACGLAGVSAASLLVRIRGDATDRIALSVPLAVVIAGVAAMAFVLLKSGLADVNGGAHPADTAHAHADRRWFLKSGLMGAAVLTAGAANPLVRAQAKVTNSGELDSPEALTRLQQLYATPGGSALLTELAAVGLAAPAQGLALRTVYRSGAAFEQLSVPVRDKVSMQPVGILGYFVPKTSTSSARPAALATGIGTQGGLQAFAKFVIDTEHSTEVREIDPQLLCNTDLPRYVFARALASKVTVPPGF